MELRYDARENGEIQTSSLEQLLESYPKLSEALQTCSLRFVINLPEESLLDAPRLCFELQEAYWFYLDFIYEEAKRELPPLNQMNFCNAMLESSDILRGIYRSAEDKQRLFASWREYSRKVPLRGAILLNASLEKCLMVQPWKGDKWMFPRGKINEGESEVECAVREVMEETGIDVSGMVDAASFVKADIHSSGTPVKLFLVPGIPDQVECAPRTRREISKIGWIDMTKLPGWAPGGAHGQLRFIAVEPFVPELRKYVEARRRQVPSHAPKQKQQLQQQPRLTAEAEVALPSPPFSPPPAAVGRHGRGEDGVSAPDAAPGASSRRRRSRHKAQQPQHQKDELQLDLAKVMKEFDRGWEAKSGKVRG